MIAPEAFLRERPPMNLAGERVLRLVADAFRDRLEVGGEIEPHLAAVLRDVLDHSGGLARAQIAFALCRSGDVSERDGLDVATAIEYFHTASLLFDDLPFMDDAVERRGRTCPHHVWGEAVAVLGALALITRAYELIWRVIGKLDDERRGLAGELVSSCLGVRGVLDGQSRDLHFRVADGGPREALAATRGKTVSLVRLTLVLPALVGGAGEDTLELLDRLALHWGLAYQIEDDFKDSLMSRLETGKSTARDELLGRPNLALAEGPESALDRLGACLRSSRALLAELSNRRWSGFACLRRLQTALEVDAAEVAGRLQRRVGGR